MNQQRRQLVKLAARSSAAVRAWPGQSPANVTERSGSPDRKVTHKTFWSNTLSCDNAAVPVSQLSGRLATLADLGSAQQCTLLKNSVEGPFYFCTNPDVADIALGQAGAPLAIALRAVNAATCQPPWRALRHFGRCRHARAGIRPRHHHPLRHGSRRLRVRLDRPGQHGAFRRAGRASGPAAGVRP
jgi:hypothetical protein